MLSEFPCRSVLALQHGPLLGRAGTRLEVRASWKLPSWGLMASRKWNVNRPPAALPTDEPLPRDNQGDLSHRSALDESN